MPGPVRNAGPMNKPVGPKKRAQTAWTCRRRILITRILSRGNLAAASLCRGGFIGFGGSLRWSFWRHSWHYGCDDPWEARITGAAPRSPLSAKLPQLRPKDSAIKAAGIIGVCGNHDKGKRGKVEGHQ